MTEAMIHPTSVDRRVWTTVARKDPVESSEPSALPAPDGAGRNWKSRMPVRTSSSHSPTRAAVVNRPGTLIRLSDFTGLHVLSDYRVVHHASQPQELRQLLGRQLITRPG